MFFPAGVNRQGWRDIAKALQNCLKGEDETATSSNDIIREEDFPCINDKELNRWNRALICEVDKPVLCWKEIGDFMRSKLQLKEAFSLSPFDLSKSLYFADSIECVESLIKKNWWCFNDLRIQFSRWNPSCNCIKSLNLNPPKPVWLAVKGIPFHLWNLKTFTQIGNLWGGFIKVHENSLSGKDYGEAYIQVSNSSKDKEEFRSVSMDGRNFMVVAYEIEDIEEAMLFGWRTVEFEAVTEIRPATVISTVLLVKEKFKTQIILVHVRNLLPTRIV